MQNYRKKQIMKFDPDLKKSNPDQYFLKLILQEKLKFRRIIWENV